MVVVVVVEQRQTEGYRQVDRKWWNFQLFGNRFSSVWLIWIMMIDSFTYRRTSVWTCVRRTCAPKLFVVFWCVVLSNYVLLLIVCLCVFGSGDDWDFLCFFPRVMLTFYDRIHNFTDQNHSVSFDFFFGREEIQCVWESSACGSAYLHLEMCKCRQTGTV